MTSKNQDGKTYTTTKLQTETIGDTKYRYVYDANGNITRIYSVLSEDSEITLHKYTYDNYGQLTRDMDSENSVIVDYTYDTSGNIIQKKTTAWNGDPSSPVVGDVLSTVNYTYTDGSWKDLMTSYNGQTITYDAIGNPLNYRDGITLTWQNGRELASFANSDVSVAYTYDIGGMRTSKTVTSGATTDKVEYIYDDGLLRKMIYGSAILTFSYDSYGSPVSLAYQSTPTSSVQYYFYALNSRGDVVGLYNSTGAITALYEYDAYGKLLGVTNSSGTAITAKYVVANLNPLRYRSYVYDTETGLYYLQSRYYDPTTCRFVNGDEYASTGKGLTGHNMFAYCNNNPVLRVDSTGDCYYTADGRWAHDNWEFLGAYKIELDPKAVDVTEKLNDAMKDNAEQLKEYNDEHGYIDTVQFFIDKVKPEGDWDFKSQEDWSLDHNKTYLYNGTMLRFDDIGNIHYGYVGRVIFSSDTLLLAGGVVQIYTGSSNWSYSTSNFDDPQDQWAIQFGCNLWDTEALS